MYTTQEEGVVETVKKSSWLALLLCLSMLTAFLPLAAQAESLYIIPDSNTRLLTREEVWEYQYDTLLYAFNEIYARHGYKFETGSRCYNWFIQMPWYTPNENESSTDHHATYSQCSEIENRNRDLIVSVRNEMRELGTTNPGGIGMPTPPSYVDKPRGFAFVSLKTGQKLPVYAAPSYQAFRANNGKAMVSTNGAVYALGYDSGWMLMLYEANYAGQYRVGYVDTAQIKGSLPALDQLSWAWTPCTVLNTVALTDDPALTGNALTTLPAGTSVTYLTTMFNSSAWDYIETTVNGQTVRGFVPEDSLSLMTDSTELEEEGVG